jgi:hypothetical protein
VSIFEKFASTWTSTPPSTQRMEILKTKNALYTTFIYDKYLLRVNGCVDVKVEHKKIFSKVKIFLVTGWKAHL